MDDVFRCHMSLRARQEEGRRYAPAWGVGRRHLYGSQVYDLNTLGPNGANQWAPTVPEFGIHSLDGPQCAPHFTDLSDEVEASLVSLV